MFFVTDVGEKIETLKDVVKQLLTSPFFIEGESMVELFQQGVDTDYEAVYKMPVRE
uniref:Uncharacterized protein n=1 Tax=Tetranychus urticae TaxID=32264 RepID=T1KVR3_TETUR